MVHSESIMAHQDGMHVRARRRPNRVSVFFSDNEIERVQRRFKHRGIDLSQHLRMLALDDAQETKH